MQKKTFDYETPYIVTLEIVLERSILADSKTDDNNDGIYDGEGYLPGGGWG